MSSTESKESKSEPKKEKTVRVYHANRSQGSFQHGPYVLTPGGHCDVPQSVADIWLTHTSFGAALVTLREEAPRAPSAEEIAESDKLRAELAESKDATASQAEKIKNLEKLLQELQTANATKIPVVQDQKPGEHAPGQEVVTGEKLKAVQEEITSKRKR